MQKENPNPTIHATQKRSHPSRSSVPSLGSADIHRYNLGSPTPPRHVRGHISADECNALPVSDESVSFGLNSITAEDRSVALALSAAAYPPSDPSNNNSNTTAPSDSASSPLQVNILRQAGFALFHPQRIEKQCSAIRYPSYAPYDRRKQASSVQENNRDAVTSYEVFDIIRNIQDPEHPLTLEQLNVVRLELIEVVDLKGGDEDQMQSDRRNYCSQRRFSTVHVEFTPTIPHCSMATLIGLSIRVKLLRSLPSRFKVVVKIESGTHASEHAVNKQLGDKERVRAALENEHLLGVVNRCIAGGMQMQ
ncbi:hypothetical protein ACHAWF_013447 [Thalassiosira exigua]